MKHKDPTLTPQSAATKRPPTPTVSSAGALPTTLTSPAAVLQMQQQVGNRAVTRQLGRAAHPWPGLGVQRQIENETYNDDDKTRTQLAWTFFDSFNKAVDKAFQWAITVPSLSAYAGLNGYTKLWQEKWDDYLAHKRPSLMAATFGYVIESLVCEKLSEFCPAPPPNCSLMFQVLTGGTRPDVVLVYKGQQIAWLDLTAANSADHIFEKDDWSKKINIFAEVTYPSLDPGYLALMRQNRDNKGKLDPEEFKKRVESARQEYQERKEYWTKLGQNFTWRYLGSTALKSCGLSRDTMELGNNANKVRNFIHKHLEETFKAKMDLKMVPSVLKALGVNSTSWKFNIGFSENEKAGEAWLMDYDPGEGGKGNPKEEEKKGSNDMDDE